MQEFLVPDYFPEFKCKIGACRHVCCNGWPISISMKDYFRLVGLPCSDDLRHRIDVSLHICEKATDERYAQICPRFDGRCALMYPDGRCALHAEYGEEALPALCRLYPRGVRPGGECSCANSCEAVVELLVHRDKCLEFKKIQMDYGWVGLPAPKEEEAGRLERRLALIGMMQDRSLKIPFRLLNVGRSLRNYPEVTPLEARRLDAILWRRDDSAGKDVEEGGELQHGLELAEKIVGALDERSGSLRDYGVAALEWFGAGDEQSQYGIAHAAFEAKFPCWEKSLEHLLVNQMFFEQFPFNPNGEGVFSEFMGLCLGYTLLRFLCIGYIAHHDTEEDFVDVCAALFRLISHTDFGRNAAAILESLDFSSYQTMHDLMIL